MLMSLVATAGVSVSLPKLLFLAASTLLLLLLGANLLLLGIAFRRIIRFAIDSIEEVEKHKKSDSTRNSHSTPNPRCRERVQLFACNTCTQMDSARSNSR